MSSGAATWSALAVTQGREMADHLAEILEDFDPAPVGTGVFEIEDGSDRWEVGAWFDEKPDALALELLALSNGIKPFVLSEVPEVDWVAHVRRELTPVRAGRFFVHGSHDADQIPDGVEALHIEAAMAFGTGHHGTTKGCLEAVDRLAGAGFTPERVADIGTGTAVLAMAAARLWPVTVLASDIDPQAVDVAAANVIANGLDGRVICFEAMGFDHPLLDDNAPFDLIFANILKQPLIDLAPSMAKAVAEGGKIILSGILTTQADEVAQVYGTHGFTLDRRDDLGEWSTLVMTRV